MGSSDEDVTVGRSDYHEVNVCDVNSNSDISLQQKRLLNTQLRMQKNLRGEEVVVLQAQEPNK